MDEGEEVASEPTGLWGHNALGGDCGYRGVDRIAALLENLLAGFGGQVVRCYDRVRRQEVSRSGSRRLRASRTERTTALDSSPST
jgi:hypothetical protein